MTRWLWIAAGLASVTLIAGVTVWWWTTRRTLPPEFSRRLPATVQHLTEVKYALDDRLLLLGSATGTVLSLDLASERLQTLEPSSRQPIVALSVSPDGALVASGLNGELRAWQMPDFKAMPLQSPEMPVTAMVFRKTNELSVLFGLADGRIATAAPKKKLTLRKSGHRGIKAMTLQPGSGVLVTAGTEGKLVWYDLKADSQLGSAAEHRTEVPCLAWSPDGKWLVSGDWNGQLCVWDPAKREVVARAEQPDAVVGLAWRDQRLITGSWDGRIRLWNCDGQQLQLDRTINTGLSIHALTVSVDGAQAVTVSNTADVEFWNVK